MVTLERKSQIFNNLKTDPENNRCFECESEDPSFVSVNNGCFICSVCTQSHIALGPEISRVKDLNEEWDIEELKLITAGGNNSLKEFFNHYNISGTPPNFKYLTRASFFYRDMLSVVSQDREYEHECPSIEEGIQLVASFYPELPGEAMAPEEAKVPQVENNKKNKFWARVRNAYIKTVDASNKVVEKVTDRLNRYSNENKTIKKIEDKTIYYGGKVEAKIGDLVNRVKNKPSVRSSVDQINYATASLADEVRITYTKFNTNPSVQKLKQDTMNFVKELASSIKGSNRQ